MIILSDGDIFCHVALPRRKIRHAMELPFSRDLTNYKKKEICREALDKFSFGLSGTNDVENTLKFECDQVNDNLTAISSNFHRVEIENEKNASITIGFCN